MNSSSVLISIHYTERPDYFRQCLESLVEQTLPADDGILVQDGPISENLQRVVEQFHQTRNIFILQLMSIESPITRTEATHSKFSNRLTAKSRNQSQNILSKND